MRKIDCSNSYLKNQVRKNFAKAVLSILTFCVIVFALTLRILSALQVNTLEEVGLLLSVIPLIGFYFYLHKYRIYSGGLKGEKVVTKLLTSNLSDEYYLLNNLYLHDGGGDIDHIVLGPNGVFVLETKNWSGKIFCNGDEWQKVGKRNFSSSPSRQVKRNALKIKKLIDNSTNLRVLGIWVEGIVVLTNNHASLQLNNPTVPILKLSQLLNHIAADRSLRSISSKQLETIEKEIIKQKR